MQAEPKRNIKSGNTSNSLCRVVPEASVACRCEVGYCDQQAVHCGHCCRRGEGQASDDPHAGADIPAHPHGPVQCPCSHPCLHPRPHPCAHLHPHHPQVRQWHHEADQGQWLSFCQAWSALGSVSTVGCGGEGGERMGEKTVAVSIANLKAQKTS